ncbi:hypothetical protein [Bacillus toyonensis]|uniref:hypothetical protein n=1 Tax=Bacillus toyonensis TaxID=155322 RepID=UPI002E1B2EDE|nr:hypothetical protein [Bacillus toyonensis]
MNKTNYLEEIYTWITNHNLTTFGNLNGTSMFKVENANYDYKENELKIYYEDEKRSTLQEKMFHSDSFTVTITKNERQLQLILDFLEQDKKEIPFIISFEK